MGDEKKGKGSGGGGSHRVCCERAHDGPPDDGTAERTRDDVLRGEAKHAMAEATSRVLDRVLSDLSSGEGSRGPVSVILQLYLM